MNLKITCVSCETDVSGDGYFINVRMTDIDDRNLNNTEVAKCVLPNTYLKANDDSDIMDEIGKERVMEYFGLREL